jgi:membrane associated rhomboid family serine protease
VPIVQRQMHFHRLILPTILHVNIWHLAWNMVALMMLGNF